jgi:hypothetical protein
MPIVIARSVGLSKPPVFVRRIVPDVNDLFAVFLLRSFGKYMKENPSWGQEEGWLTPIPSPPCQLIPFSRLPENFPGESLSGSLCCSPYFAGADLARLPLETYDFLQSWKS